MKIERIMQAGRMIDDNDDINYLLDAFRRRLFDVLSMLMFKTVVWDCDGTMTEFNYNDSSLLPCRDDELYKYSETNDIYKNSNALKYSQYIISHLNPDDEYVLTVTVDALREKRQSSFFRSSLLLNRKTLSMLVVVLKRTKF